MWLTVPLFYVSNHIIECTHGSPYFVACYSLANGAGDPALRILFLGGTQWDQTGVSYVLLYIIFEAVCTHISSSEEIVTRNISKHKILVVGFNRACHPPQDGKGVKLDGKSIMTDTRKWRSRLWPPANTREWFKRSIVLHYINWLDSFYIYHIWFLHFHFSPAFYSYPITFSLVAKMDDMFFQISISV